MSTDRCFELAVRTSALRKVRAIRQCSHLDLQHDRILLFAHIGVYIYRTDFGGGRIEIQGHLVLRQDVISNDDPHDSSRRTERDIDGVLRLFNSLGIGRQVHAEKALDLLPYTPPSPLLFSL